MKANGQAAHAGVYGVASAWLSDTIRRLQHNDMQLLDDVFDKLVDSEKGLVCKAAEAATRRGQNRYSDVLCFDHNRVKLLPASAQADRTAGDDYINASHVRSGPLLRARRAQEEKEEEEDGADEAHYIATQGPLASTVPAFWRMVLERGCSSIVMLTRDSEGSTVKSAPYLPTTGVGGPPARFDDISVSLLEQQDLAPDLTLRRLQVARAPAAGGSAAVAATRLTVSHYQCLSWRDRSVPESSRSIRLLCSRLDPRAHAPALVHCSAGIGRTGAFITVDIVLRRLRALAAAAAASSSSPPLTPPPPLSAAGLAMDSAAHCALARALDVPAVVNGLRQQRRHMVQTPAQLLFCYTAVRDECDERVSGAGADAAVQQQQ